jgi:hypothetical protein
MEHWNDGMMIDKFISQKPIIPIFHSSTIPFCISFGVEG